MIELKTVQAEKVPAAGPYSQAVIAGDFIFTAGQIPLDGKTGQIVEGIDKQTHQTFSNLIEVLKTAGTNLEHVVKTTIYLKNITDFAKVNEIYASYFVSHKPVRSTVEVARLPKDVLIEIDAIAVKKSE